MPEQNVVLTVRSKEVSVIKHQEAKIAAVRVKLQFTNKNLLLSGTACDLNVSAAFVLAFWQHQNREP